MNRLAIVAVTFATLTAASAFPSSAQPYPRGDYPCTAGPQCPSSGGSEDNCADQLGHLKRVYPAEVRGVDNSYRVWVTEICTSSVLMRSDGNAAYLRTSIADNDVLVDVLGQKGFGSDDVVAVRMMGDDTINLYVHHFGRISSIGCLAKGGNSGSRLSAFLNGQTRPMNAV